MIELKGIAASPGIAIGRTFFLDKEEFAVKKHEIDKNDVKSEIARLDEAIDKSRLELIEIKKRITGSVGRKNAKIFDAHLLLFKDPLFIGKIHNRIRKELLGAEYSVWITTEELSKIFLQSGDSLVSERAVDIHDVSRRVLRNLLGRARKILASLEEEVVVVAADLAPSDTAQMRKERVTAFVTDMGGRTSHVAIMARSLEIPAVVGLKEITERVEPGDLLIVDGDTGTVIVNPSGEVLSRYEEEKKEISILKKELTKLKDVSARTIDGCEIKLLANIEVPEEAESAIQHGAQGVGLYRTEFLYLNRYDLPGEEEQFEAYKHVASLMKSYPVIIRTLDLGGDKFLSHFNLAPEINPSLGCRGIRLCLERTDIFKVHLRAILRASVFGNLKIMYPLISGIEELRRANQILEEVKQELVSGGIDFNRNMDVGIMVEVPSAAITSDLLAKECKFFSLGTNDLIQYSLAIDRVNEKIAYLYEPLHPGVLRLIKGVIDTAHSAGINIGMCGEMAGDPLFIKVLIGMGLNEFSMSSISIPTIKEIIRNISLAEAKELTLKVMSFSSAEEIENFLKKK
jgi:phosphoenolpyruvate-protein phosphotransferase (PTS system enzyme I)